MILNHMKIGGLEIKMRYSALVTVQVECKCCKIVFPKFKNPKKGGRRGYARPSNAVTCSRPCSNINQRRLRVPAQ